MTLTKLLVQLVAHYANLLGLGDWDFEVIIKESNDYKAACEADYEYKQAKLFFNPERLDPDDTRDVHRHVIHELLHCHMEKLAFVAREMAGNDVFKKEMVRAAHEAVTTDLELALWGLFQEDVLGAKLERKQAPRK